LLKKGENRFTGRESKRGLLFKRKWYYRSTWSAVPICIKAQNAGVDAIVAEGFEAEVMVGMKRQLLP
jgi:hypothetical protein